MDAETAKYTLVGQDKTMPVTYRHTNLAMLKRMATRLRTYTIYDPDGSAIIQKSIDPVLGPCIRKIDPLKGTPIV